AVTAEGVAGFGFTDRFSGAIVLATDSVENLPQGSGSFALGLFGTIVETSHFDFDLYFSVSSAMELTPGIELNFDFKPDLELCGLYLRAEHTVSRVEDKPETATSDATYKASNTTALTFGTYYTITEKMQLLLEFDMGVDYAPSVGARSVDIGSVALGYNVVVHKAIELITQISVDIPQDGEPVAFGANVGFVATM
ncbi:hypothetical protein KAH37_06260, partial [bacterium]|nr:hypothetical protein [bacterium]